MILIRNLLAGISLAAISGVPLWAQQATPVAGGDASADDTQGAADGADIVVTGSRIGMSGVTAPTPVTVVSSDQLKTAAPGNLALGLNQLPQFRSSSKPEAGITNPSGAAGANQLNLRSLGVARTLVLLDGRRVVPSSPNFAVDFDTLPEGLVRRVDVVTGGASAAYGSDAVAGVVNVILDDRLEGLKIEAQRGISDIGDAPGGRVALTYGGKITDNLRVILAIDGFERKGLNNTDRRHWSSVEAGVVANVPATAQPNRFVIADDVFASFATEGGLITSGPLAGTSFGAAGQTTPFSYGRLRSSIFMVGGVGTTRTESALTASLRRGSAFGRLIYDIPGGPELSLDVNYARSRVKQFQLNNLMVTGNQMTIFADNPFIPDDIRTRMQTAGVNSFTMGRVFGDIPPMYFQNDVEVFRTAIAVKGDLGSDWTYDAYYTHGVSITELNNTNTLNFNRAFAAVDAVSDPVTGDPVCRSTLLFGRNPGCVALDPFGVGAPSEDAARYILGDQQRRQRAQQDVAAVNLSGPLFHAWASEPVSLAVGAEYRREKARQTVSDNVLESRDYTGVRGAPTSQQGLVGPFLVGNPKPFAGSITVKEAYAELNAPLMSDRSFINLLSVNAAGRYTDYSLSGGAFTWKLGATYKPFEDLRLRITRSRDIRAPNLFEAFAAAGSQQSQPTVRDPVTGATFTALAQQAGNPDLKPERADTLTYGATYTPSWLPGLSLTADAYKIDVEGAIATLTPQQTLDACAAGSAMACANITVLGPTNLRILIPNLNLNSLKTSGVDLEVNYTTAMLGGRVTLRGFANYQGKYEITAPGAPPIKMAGQVGTVSTSANPKWLATASVTYAHDRFELFLQERFISAGLQNATYVEGVDIDDNHVPAVFYTDATVKFKVDDDRFVAFLSVNNLFNKAPPLVPVLNASVISNTNYALYDVIGRYITAGVSVKF